MKKALILIAIMLGMAGQAMADGSILDQIYAGFVGRAKLSIESDTDGKNRPSFLVNYVEIGQLKGGHIAAIDAGVGGTILPSNFHAAEWTTGGKLHLAPLIKNFVNLPPEWEFMGNIELDARGSYDWTLRHPFWGIVAAYPFR